MTTHGRDGRLTPLGQTATAERPTLSPEPQSPASYLVSTYTTQKAGLKTETYMEANQTRFQKEKSKACVMRNSYNEIPFHYLATIGDFYRKETNQNRRGMPFF